MEENFPERAAERTTESSDLVPADKRVVLGAAFKNDIFGSIFFKRTRFKKYTIYGYEACGCISDISLCGRRTDRHV